MQFTKPQFENGTLGDAIFAAAEGNSNENTFSVPVGAIGGKKRGSWATYCPVFENNRPKKVIWNSGQFSGIDIPNKRIFSKVLIKVYADGKLVKRFVKKTRRNNTNNLNIKFKGGLLMDTLHLKFIKFYK